MKRLLLLAVLISASPVYAQDEEENENGRPAGANADEPLEGEPVFEEPVTIIDEEEPPTYMQQDDSGSNYNSSTRRSGGTGEQIEAGPPGAGDKPWKPVKQKTFTAKQKKAECAKYEGKFISYYEQLYKVEDCHRREIREHSLLQKLNKNRRDIFVVDNDTIIMLEEGKPYTLSDLVKPRSCQQLGGNYITSGASELYYVENCKMRAFPDFDTFEDHREKNKKSKAPVLELTEKEFKSLKVGREFPSVLDKMLKELIEGTAGVDVIPVDEACRGVNNKVVSYYARLYKIENCRKRELDPEQFLRRPGNSRLKFIELSSEQWLSLPDGKPMPQ